MLLFHLVAIGNYVFAMWYDQNYVDVPLMKHESDMKFFKGRLKFLTIWNMLLQGLFFTVCLINDLIGTNEKFPNNKPLIRKFKDMLFSSLAFPLSMFVGLTFWAIYFVDRELVFPRALDPYFPTWLNHVMHTNIMLFVLIEMSTSFRAYPPRKKGLAVLVVFMAAYLVWIHVIHSYSGMWVYPILNVLNFPMRVVFFAGLLGLSVGLYVVGEKLNGLVWRREMQVESSKRKI